MALECAGLCWIRRLYVCTGYEDRGGDCSKVQSQLAAVQSIHPTMSAFTALKVDGSVVAWGEAEDQVKAVSEHLNKLQESSAVTFNTHNGNVIAAWKADSRVVAWGGNSYGGDCIKFQDQVTVVSVATGHDVG